jgi:hypothetical protein
MDSLTLGKTEHEKQHKKVWKHLVQLVVANLRRCVYSIFETPQRAQRPIDTHLLTSRIVKGNAMWPNAAVVKNKVALQVCGELHGSQL